MSSLKTFFVSWIALLLVGIFGKDAKPPQKVMSGTSAKPGEFKYQVSMKRNGIHDWGGILISSRHVLTAAHCFIGLAEPPYTQDIVLVTGMTKQSVGGEVHLPKNVTIHPDYVEGTDENSFRHDIAIVMLATPANTNELQVPVSLPSTNLNEKVTGILSGWGRLKKYGIFPDELQKSPVTIITLKECRTKLKLENRTKAFDTHICAFDGLNRGFCSGDSGGPLVYNNEVVGIVSYTVLCGRGVRPDMYTRVYAYKDFILETMQRL